MSLYYKLAEYGSEIIKKRNDFIKKLEEVSSEIHSSITSGKETLTVEYEANIPYGENLREEFLAETEKNLEKDLFQRTTSKGPHKDDLKICINGVDIRHFGSQGQQRTAALSLKLAEIRLIKEITGEDAVLLLDDVLSELDRSRQSYLVNCLNKVQIFITTTEISEEVADSFPDGITYRIKNGTIEK